MTPYKILIRWRRFLSNTSLFKKCFKCDNVYPLFLFKVNTSKYQRPASKGRCFECKICNLKRKL